MDFVSFKFNITTPVFRNNMAENDRQGDEALRRGRRRPDLHLLAACHGPNGEERVRHLRLLGADQGKPAFSGVTVQLLLRRK